MRWTGDAIDRSQDFAVSQVRSGVEAIDGLDLGDTGELLRDLAEAVVDRQR